MQKQVDIMALDADTLAVTADAAARAIPPVWPLASSVAVNPFLGQAGETLAEAGARLARVAGIRVTMPRAWYAGQIASGAIRDEDIVGALAAAPVDLRPADIAAVKAAAARPAPRPRRLPTIADLAAEASGIDWPGLIEDRFGAWAAGYFDEGQALWTAPRGRNAYAAWRAVATHDLTPEIAGLSGFAAHVADAPEDALEAMARAASRLALSRPALETYFHQLLMTLGGWAHYARYRLWQAELGGGTDRTITDFLVIRLIWEHALLDRYSSAIAAQWEAARAGHEVPPAPTPDLVLDAILQEAAERAAQRALAATLAAPSPVPAGSRPALQAAFCIDVRSEVFRRALEGVNPGIRTLGFAGFFGLAAAHRRFASDIEEKRLPVLLNPGVTTRSGGPADLAADQAMRFAARAKRAWGRFKLAAVSSFAFVEATGPIYVAKLVRDALGLAAPGAPNDPPPRLDPALDLEKRTDAAEAVLRAMSLTENFARIVLLAGHGASVVNNPHASALHCGACGGYSGEVNARLLAALLNDRDVRTALTPRGIAIPEGTLFLGALHDTTTDRVTIYAADQAMRFAARAKRAWGRFKLAAVSSFAFVEATGPIYVAKLVRDALGLAAPGAPNDPPPRLDPALDLEKRTDAAEAVLRAMSLTENFARIVLLAGHGASVVNNPHASALHCGACGGYSGEVNARLLAALLNDRDVRTALTPRGIAIPEDTLFLGALHDTTTDRVTIYAADHPSTAHATELARVRGWLEAAGKVTRAERALRLPRAASPGDIARRSRDWAEVRPEWALAGCKAFIAAPRRRTAGKSLEGRAFLHDYDWRRDTSFGVLELIMTAPVVVASWISLQYYGSTVAPQVFGAGNKLLHNVVGGIGVVEGNGGTLRAGLPWQSVHDGEKLIHDPLRLSVCIEAPREAMTGVLERHPAVRALFDNRWLHLFALDDAGRMAWRYAGDLAWDALEADVRDGEPKRLPSQTAVAR